MAKRVEVNARLIGASGIVAIAMARFVLAHHHIHNVLRGDSDLMFFSNFQIKHKV